jgi:hypothetical protein
LAGVTSGGVEFIRGVDYADVIRIEDGRFRSVAPTAPIATELDAVQVRIRIGGPCPEAAVADAVFAARICAARTPRAATGSAFIALSAALIAMHPQLGSQPE